MNKHQVAEILEAIGLLLELKGENPFKTRAYGNAARTIEALEEPLEKIVEEERLGEIKGIGKALQEKIATLVTTGKLKYYDDLKDSVPAGLLEMADIPRLGPKKVKVLYDELGIDSIEKLETACKEGKVAGLSGFGNKTADNILEGIENRRKYASRHLLSETLAISQPLLDGLREHPDVIRCSIAGSQRRQKETIGDVDFLVSSKEPKDVIGFFVDQPGVKSVSAKGDTKASVLLENGIQADLRVVSDSEFPFALLYFTGSKEHNIVLRQRAIERGLRLNEYGLFRSKEETRDPEKLVKCRTEDEIFEKLDLHFIPPELREDHGEFDVAEKQQLPRLVEWTDLRGSLHNHSTWSDGHDTLEEIAEKIDGELGCAYWAVTDHSKSSFQANGLTAERLRKQIREIGEINRRLEDEGRDFRLLTGTEVDILPDGRLDFDDDLLAELDVVVASVHSSFTLGEKEMTLRILKAVGNPFVHTIGHLTGRLLLRREPYQVNQEAVIEACGETGTWIELNANPYRFDLDWRLWPYAKKMGVKCVINCDAHSFDHAAFLRLGAGVARKGWLTKENIVNTLPLSKLRKELAKKRKG